MRRNGMAWVMGLGLFAATVWACPKANAHCDTVDGPVVKDARAALDKNEVTPVLKWVKQDSEAEIRAAFQKALTVRKAGKEAQELADQFFFETLIRVHRAGEGAPYTGLKPAGSPLEPGVAEADKALASGSSDELVKGIQEHLATEIIERVEAERDIAIADRRPFDLEFRILLPSGEVRWISAKGRAIQDETGAVVRVFGINADITQRKEAEDALKQSERLSHRWNEFLEAVTSGTEVIVAAIDVSFCYIFFNAAYKEEIRRLAGKDIQIGSSMLETFAHAPEQQEIVVREWGKALQGESSDRLVEFGDPQGYHRVYRVRHTPIRDDDGDLIGAGEVAFDVTQQAEVEHALSQAREQIESQSRFPEENPNPVLRASGQGDVLYCNPAAMRLPAWTCEMGGRLPGSVMPLVVQAMVRGVKIEEDVRLGGRFYSITAIPIGARGYVNIYGQDITGRKDAEEALRRLNAELEDRVAEQTSEIRQARIVADRERQRLYDVLETLPVYVILLTPDYHVTFANRFFRERFGESHGKRCFEYLFDRTEACETCETYTVSRTRAPHHWEWLGPDGCNYDIFDFPFTDSTGIPLILEMGIDITERKRAENQVRESAQQLRQLSSKLLTAQEEERRRIARDIHDTIGGYLNGIIYKVENTLAQIGEISDATAKSLSSIIPVAKEAVRECRRMQTDLRPAILDDMGLVSAMGWFLREAEKIHSELHIDQEMDIEEANIPGPLRIIAFRVMQEAMTNVGKHSRANHVRVSLRKVGDRMELVIQDNGRGFNTKRKHSEGADSGGFGISSMKERTELSGGSFSVVSGHEKGTIVSASWPLANDA